VIAIALRIAAGRTAPKTNAAGIASARRNVVRKSAHATLTQLNFFQRSQEVNKEI